MTCPCLAKNKRHDRTCSTFINLANQQIRRTVIAICITQIDTSLNLFLSFCLSLIACIYKFPATCTAPVPDKFFYDLTNNRHTESRGLCSTFWCGTYIVCTSLVTQTVSWKQRQFHSGSVVT